MIFINIMDGFQLFDTYFVKQFFFLIKATKILSRHKNKNLLSKLVITDYQ